MLDVYLCENSEQLKYYLGNSSLSGVCKICTNHSSIPLFELSKITDSCLFYKPL